uniref:CASP C-terminal domain-containing protein n=1 Tax=Dunaliella tertiolecta TaxID=3047 RepID=A0A7S3QQZ2_DUNTE
MNFLQAWDIEKVAGQASKLVEQLDEYPTEHRPRTQGPNAGRALSSHQSSAAFKAWDELDFEGRKQEWVELCEQIKGLDKAGKHSPEQWQHRAKDAEYHVLRLCNMLLGLPDPLPYLANTATLTSKMAEVEARNRELQAAANAAAADTTEVTTLVEQHRDLVEKHQQLEDKMAASEAELVQARAAAAEAVSVKADAEAQAVEVQRLQETLRALRLEYERAQSSLFEIANNQDQVVGSRQREMELASEELERTQQRAAELTLERDTLVQRLEAAQEEVEILMRTSVEEGNDARGGNDGQQQQQPHPRTGRGKMRGDGVDEEGFWERQVRVRGEQVAALQAQLAQQQQAINEGAVQLEAQAQSWSNRLAAADLSISKLEAELAKRPAPHVYQELVSQVTALQQLVDVQMEAEGWGQESIRKAIATLGLTPSTTSQTLSSIQQERNRKLASDVSSLKRQLEAQGADLAAAKRDVSIMEAKANAAIALADRLEGDLAAVQHGIPSHKLPGNGKQGIPGSQHSNQHSTEGIAADGLPSESAAQHALMESVAHLPGSFGSARETSDSKSPDSQQQQQQGGTAGAALAVQGPATPDSSDPSSTSSLLDIVISQRDRFRQRMGQLEEEKGTLSEQLAHAQKQLDSCRADNISLYEKVRFIEQYSQQKGGGGGMGGGPGAGKLQVVRVDGAGVPLESQPGWCANTAASPFNVFRTSA